MVPRQQCQCLRESRSPNFSSTQWQGFQCSITVLIMLDLKGKFARLKLAKYYISTHKLKALTAAKSDSEYWLITGIPMQTIYLYCILCIIFINVINSFKSKDMFFIFSRDASQNNYILCVISSIKILYQRMHNLSWKTWHAVTFNNIYAIIYTMCKSQLLWNTPRFL